MRDFGIGAMLGVNAVVLIEYGRGFFVEEQSESDFLRLLAFSLNVAGTFMYIGLWLIAASFIIQLRRN